MNSLKTLWVVMRKELLDFFRDRRTVALSLLLSPVLVPVLLIGLFTLTENRIRDLTDKPLELPVIGKQHAPNLIAWLEGQNVTIVDPPADVAAAIAEQKADVILRIGDDYGEKWRKSEPAPVEVLSDSTRQNAEVPVKRVQALLRAYNSQVGALRLLARGVSPAAAAPLQISDTDMASEEAKRGRLVGVLLPYLLILSAFIGGAYLIMDGTAGERERQSLEPLLATPAPRGAVVSGKVAAACAVALLSLALTLLMFKLTAVISPTVGRQMAVSFSTIALLLLILMPMVFIGTTLLTYLSATAKSMKEAQSHMSWLMLLPMLPSIVLMVNPVKTQLWQFAVPFLAQNQLILKVVRGEVVSPAQWGIYLGASFALAGLMWFLAVRRYRGEQLAISG
ncbi:ABC transporter permease [Pseudoxanthomonas winnipegensis]|jgi:sodium transport system permease protein|uniref:ABC transporter permease n=1 Tax=Pseudoxanthomonas winnipegensis TaxID=2480810 RepID=A0A4Q8LUF9_9GAMM|nr:ABC transporter permease [Pseudoxanthomonas winnipegensis]RZZ88491.1 ABC transporter permease [Pseudoxanthomonas winnipegensis]TAA06914.1 ABC transporter permease [Pseudoxanthomonas winnipegensis]TAA16827.1 ABC transporter permease [Pseudoxanthomonas winnipegensis]TAA34778.1 ABC transporter permease [Pseudoxanthomonas winnipegensis]TAH73546.1 ABC transporter permease [Pseudoxanthomonas winnipegensis]